MRRLMSYQHLYALFWLSVCLSVYFVWTDGLNVAEACTVNISLLALAVSTQNSAYIQTEKVKEIVRRHILLLYDTVLLTHKLLEADIAMMEDVYCDRTLIDQHLAELSDHKAEINRLSSRLSFFINAADICEACDRLDKMMNALITRIEVYKQHQFPQVLDMMESMLETTLTPEEKKESLKTAVPDFSVALTEIRALEDDLLRHLSDGEVIRLLKRYRTLEQIKLTKS